MRKIFKNGKVHTVTHGIKDAFVLEDNKFIYVGDECEALKYQEENSQIINLENKIVLPGFNDSHMHLLGFGYAMDMVDLSTSTSLQEVKDNIKQYIKDNNISKETWVKGRGWNQDYFTDTNRFPTKQDLDEVSTIHPICITRACGHICVTNSKALELMGVDETTKQIQGGQFDLDDHNQPIGIFRENAMSLVYDKMPKYTKEEIKNMLIKACKALNSYGITSAQTDDFTTLPEIDYETIIEAYRELEKENKLSVRIYQQAQLTDIDKLKEFINKGYNTGVGSDYFKIGPLKLLGDGSLGARTAYLSTPYSDDESTCGIYIYNQETLDEMVEYAHKNNMQVAIHGIGDKMISMVIESIEKALKKYPKNDHRHGIVHCQITTKENLDKIKELGIVAYIQSIFLDYDINIVESRVGKERSKTSYNFKTLYDTTITSNGSDCPVQYPDVIKSIHCATTRKTLKGTGPFLPEQSFTFDEAVKSYTLMGAYTSFEEDKKGSIEEGKLADFVILNEDLKIVYTYLAGEIKYQNNK